MATEAAPESMPTICVYSFAKKERSQICFAPSRSVFLGSFLSVSFSFPLQSLLLLLLLLIECGPGLFNAFCLHKVESQSEARRAAIVEPDKLNGQLRLHKEANSTTHTAPFSPLSLSAHSALFA